MRRSHLDRAASLLLSSVLAASVTISSMPLSVFAEGKTENESAVAASSSSGEAAEEAASAISEDAGESETANDAAASPDFDAAALESSDNCYQIGYKAHGFTLTDIGYDKSVAALKLVFTHDNTGAQIVFMLNDDQNRAFGTVFQTAPTDDTGKLHILEHASCAACDKYPGNDVFFDITNNCYITDINAMTGDNATSYYVTSLDAKQLAAVTDFYMNCAFHSAILTDENYFKREGWRYELSDKNADLTVNGIVLNEMKGAATINQETMNDIQKTLFPDTPEQYCAGGIPSDITDLTYEDLIAFYKQAYQPSNCSTLFYGDINVDYYLQVFNDDYFAGYSKTDTKSGATQEQQPFDAPVSASFDYPVSEDTEDTGSTIAYTVAMPSDLGYINERTLSMAVSLMGDNSSELMTALNESGIGSSYGVEDTYFGPQYGILFYAAGADPSKKDDFKKIVLDSVSKMAGDGLNQDMIDNVYRGIKRSEDLARNNSDVGAQLVDKYMSSVNDNRPEELDPTDSYQQAYLQARSGACEKLMQSEIVDNNLAALVTVTPKPGLLEQNEEAEQKKLADIKAAMSDEEIDDLVQETAEFNDWLARGTNEDTLKKLQVVNAQDLKTDKEYYKQTKKTEDGMTIVTADAGAGNISEGAYLLDLSTLSDRELELLELYTGMLGLSTTDHSSEELSVLIGRYLYHCSAYVAGVTIGDKTDPCLLLSFFSDPSEARKAADVGLEATFRMDLDDSDNIDALSMKVDDALQQMTDPEKIFDEFSILTLADSDPESAINAKLSGPAYYGFLEDYAKSLSEDRDSCVSEMKALIEKVSAIREGYILVSGDGTTNDKFASDMLESLKSIQSSEAASAADSAGTAESSEEAVTADSADTAASSEEAVTADSADSAESSENAGTDITLKKSSGALNQDSSDSRDNKNSKSVSENSATAASPADSNPGTADSSADDSSAGQSVTDSLGRRASISMVNCLDKGMETSFAELAASSASSEDTAVQDSTAKGSQTITDEQISQAGKEAVKTIQEILSQYKGSGDAGTDEEIEKIQSVLQEYLDEANASDAAAADDSAESVESAATDDSAETAESAAADDSAETAESAAADESVPADTSEDDTAIDKGVVSKLVGIECNTSSTYVMDSYRNMESSVEDNAYSTIAANVLSDQYLLPVYRYGLGAYNAAMVGTIRGEMIAELYRSSQGTTDFINGLSGLPDTLRDLDISEEKLNGYKLSLLSQALTSSGNLNDGMSQIFKDLAGVSEEMTNSYYESVRNATTDDMKGEADLLADNISNSTVYVIASSAYIEAHKDSFDEIYDMR